jgi:hypothetical protein
MDSEAKKEVARLLESERKFEAIQYLQNKFNISTDDARMLIEAVEREINSEIPGSATFNTLPDSALPESVQQEIEDLIRREKKIEAIKRLTEIGNMTLQEALAKVEEVQKKIDPNYKPQDSSKGCGGCGNKLFGIFFGILSAGLSGLALLIFWAQSEQIKASDVVTGTVTSFVEDEGSTAPVISYQWKGKELVYTSNLYSTPSAYDLNETVTLYVKRENPQEVIIDSFTDRWLAVTILSGMGGFFLLLTLAFLYTGKKLKPVKQSK